MITLRVSDMIPHGQPLVQIHLSQPNKMTTFSLTHGGKTRAGRRYHSWECQINSTVFPLQGAFWLFWVWIIRRPTFPRWRVCLACQVLGTRPHRSYCGKQTPFLRMRLQKECLASSTSFTEHKEYHTLGIKPTVEPNPATFPPRASRPCQ